MNLSNKPIAMAYVPWQSFENVMDGKCGLKQGSIFENLVLPFIGTPAACQTGQCQNQPQPQPQHVNRSYGRRCSF